MTNLNPLKNRWLCLLAHSVEQEYLNKVFDELLRHYSEPHRAYHTLEHIAACLSHLDRIASKLAQPLEVELALWFHDVIYSPKMHDNEIQSASYAAKILQHTNLAPEQILVIANLIRLTQHPAIPITEDDKYLLDIDLSILGAAADIFDKYEENIRREYAQVPLLLYRHGRKKFLKAMMAKERIFITDDFHDLYEHPARSNLKRSIDKL